MKPLPSKPLKTIEDIRKFWSQNTLPVYFISPTPFNLLGLDKWVKNLIYINYIDCFDGLQQNTLIPKRHSNIVFDSFEQINSYLLGHKDSVTAFEKAPDNAVLFLFFDSKIEKQAKTLPVRIFLPKQALRKEVDSKITTTELANSVGVHSVPNSLATVKTYEELMTLSKKHGLGSNLVVQTAYGDSGKTTFFIRNESDFKQAETSIRAEPQVKVMKEIRCISMAIEACATRCGTVVGPLMTELIGIPELTPYAGGWCGNDLHQDGIKPTIRKQALDMTVKLGDALYKKGYKGYFEVDYLVDQDTDTVYLGELNPRISGVTAITNLSPFCQTHLPLFLFHLLEYSQKAFDIDTLAFNALSLEKGAEGYSGQFILKHTEKALKIIEKAPQSGIYECRDGQLHFIKASTSKLEATAPNQAFLMRIMNAGDLAYQGGDLAILFVNIPLKNKKNELTEDAKNWISAFKNVFVMRSLTSEELQLIERYQNPGARLK